MPPSQSLVQAKKTAKGTQNLSLVEGTRGDTPDVQSPTSQALVGQMQPCLDLERGVAHIRQCRETYLPKSPAEQTDDYERRLRVADLYNMFLRSVRGLTGMPFRRNPILASSLSPLIVEHWNNIDHAGTNGAVFARESFEKGMVRGHVGILVDYPTVGRLNRGDELSLKLRPYWCQVLPEQIRSWRTTSWLGRTMLSQIAIEFCVTVPVGAFGERSAKEWRVYQWTPPSTVTWELWEEDGHGRPVRTQSGTVANQTEIPLAISYLGMKLGPLMTVPPLLDLAYTTISHYQVLSDHRYSLHKASVPLLTAFGRSDTTQPLITGVNMVVDVPTGGDLKYIEHNGSALGSSRQELQDMEVRGAAQGVAMLSRVTPDRETAEAKRIDKAEQDSTLSVAAYNHQLALQLAMRFHANYLKIDLATVEPPVKLNTDFQELSFDPSMVAAIHNMKVANNMSIDMMWDLLQAGNILPQNFDREKERKRLDEAQSKDIAMFAPIAPKSTAPSEPNK